MGSKLQSLFFGPKNKALAKKISIKTPNAFHNSVQMLKQNGLTNTEKRGLVLARNRARAQLARKDLSMRERKQFRTISRMRI